MSNVYLQSSHNARASSGRSKPTSGKTAESDMKPSEMLLDLNDDCKFITYAFLSYCFIKVFASMLRHCWFGDRKASGLQAYWVLVCWW